jgi:hypothetical protein
MPHVSRDHGGEYPSSKEGTRQSCLFNGVIADDKTSRLRCFQHTWADLVRENLEGAGPKSIEPSVSASRPAEPSGRVPHQ